MGGMTQKRNCLVFRRFEKERGDCFFNACHWATGDPRSVSRGISMGADKTRKEEMSSIFWRLAPSVLEQRIALPTGTLLALPASGGETAVRDCLKS